MEANLKVAFETLQLSMCDCLALNRRRNVSFLDLHIRISACICGINSFGALHTLHFWNATLEEDDNDWSRMALEMKQ